MRKLMLKAGLGVVAAGALAGAAVFLAGTGGDAAKPAGTVAQQPVHGSKVGFNPNPFTLTLPATPDTGNDTDGIPESGQPVGHPDSGQPAGAPDASAPAVPQG